VSSDAAMAVTPGGLHVPAGVVDAAVAQGQLDGPKDADGRNRIVLARKDRRALDAAILLLAAAKLAIIVVCRRCEQPMAPEDRDSADRGYGCNCSRVHFQPGGEPGRLK
jgi:hypothetical protein